MFRSRAGEEFARYFRNKDPAFEKIPILVMYTDEAVTEETFVPNYDSFVRMPFYWQFPFISITSESKRSVMTEYVEGLARGLSWKPMNPWLI